MRKRSPAVLFDLDGTLLDTLEDIATAANETLAELGHPVHRAGDYRMMIGDGVVNLLRRAMPSGADTEPAMGTAIRRFREIYGVVCLDRSESYPGIEDLLDRLAARDVPLGVLSNKPDEFTRLLVERRLGRHGFTAVLGASDAFPKKPDPTAATALAGRLRRSARECLFVGDGAVDVETARRAGMVAVGAVWGFRGAAELAREGADHLVAVPAEIDRIVDALAGPPALS